MIRVLTGQPGAGKTLRAVWYMQQARREGRPVYVHGVPDIKVPGVQALEDPLLWHECPIGSLIVIDEAHAFFGGVHRENPPHIEALATLRHRGHDLILITQHPSSFCKFARVRVGRHEHLFRVGGQQAANVYAWNEVQDDPRSMAAKEIAESSVWLYPTDVFGLYRSTVLHTVKPRMPRIVYWLAGVLLSLLVVVWYSVGEVQAIAAPGETAAASQSGSAALAPPTRREAPPVRTPEQWLAQFQPLVPHRPESAPAYFGREAEAPRLICISVENRECRCYTHDGVPWSGVRVGVCRQIARDGQRVLYPQESRPRGGQRKTR